MDKNFKRGDVLVPNGTMNQSDYVNLKKVRSVKVVRLASNTKVVCKVTAASGYGLEGNNYIFHRRAFKKSKT